MTEVDQAGRDVARKFELAEQVFVTLRTLLKTLGWLGAAYLAADVLKAYAGLSTSVSANLAISILADIKFTIALTLAGAATAWAVVERRLRHHKVEYLQNRVIELETKVDPKRSSSGLTTKGKTNPKDLKP